MQRISYPSAPLRIAKKFYNLQNHLADTSASSVESLKLKSILRFALGKLARDDANSIPIVIGTGKQIKTRNQIFSCL